MKQKTRIGLAMAAVAVLLFFLSYRFAVACDDTDHAIKLWFGFTSLLSFVGGLMLSMGSAGYLVDP